MLTHYTDNMYVSNDGFQRCRVYYVHDTYTDRYYYEEASISHCPEMDEAMVKRRISKKAYQERLAELKTFLVEKEAFRAFVKGEAA